MSIMMSPKLGLPGRDINSDWTICLAPLARETERKRIFDGATIPAVGDDFSTGHLVKQMRTTSGRMPFLSRGDVRRTHHFVADGATAALPDAYAACRGMRE